MLTLAHIAPTMGTGTWAESYNKSVAFVAQLTLQEKVWIHVLSRTLFG